tara:strand:- start:14 stop:271 length:258 start_codon:yes stop_codon:yes gene_type:complete
MSRYPIIHVVWLDAEHPAGEWEPLESLQSRKLPEIESAGFLVAEDTHRLIIASAVDGDHCSGEMTIPRDMIIKRKILRRAVAQKK